MAGHSLESRILMGASRLGIDPYEYRQQLEAGNRWCSICQKWEPVENFGPHIRRASGLNSACIASVRLNAREYMRRKRAAMRSVS